MRTLLTMISVVVGVVTLAQRPFLRPIFFYLYVTIRHLHCYFNKSYHFYADDTQLYLSVKYEDLCNLINLDDCLAAMRCLRSHNFLKLSEDKTEVLIKALNRPCNRPWDV